MLCQRHHTFLGHRPAAVQTLASNEMFSCLFPYRNRWWPVASKTVFLGSTCRFAVQFVFVLFSHSMCLQTGDSKFMFLWKFHSYNSLINLHEGPYQSIPTLIYHGAKSAFCYNPTQNHKMHLWLARLEYVRIIPIPIAWPSWPPPSHIYMLLAQVAPSNL